MNEYLESEFAEHVSVVARTRQALAGELGRQEQASQAPMLVATVPAMALTARAKAAIAEGKPWEDTFPLRRHDGTMRPHLSRAVPMCDQEGRVMRWFGTNTDITERIEADSFAIHALAISCSLRPRMSVVSRCT